MFNRIKSLPEKFRSRLKIGLTASQVALSAQEFTLLYLMSTMVSPEALFPFIVADIALTTMPAFLTQTSTAQICNKLIGGITSSTAAVLALTAFKGPAAAVSFDVALGAGSLSSIVDTILKYKNSELTKTDFSLTAANIMKNTLLQTVITMGKKFGEVSPSEILEIINKKLEEKLPEDMKAMVYAGEAAALLATFVGLVVLVKGMVRECASANSITEARSPNSARNYRSLEEGDESINGNDSVIDMSPTVKNLIEEGANLPGGNKPF